MEFPEPDPKHPQKVSRDTAEHSVAESGVEIWRLVSRPELSVVREWLPPRAGEPRHLHLSARQFLLVLSGRALVDLGGDVHELASGEGLDVPRGAVHKLSNPGAVDLELLVVSQPHDRSDRLLVRDQEGNL